MNKLLLFLAIFYLGILGCKQVTLNHPAEGAGGVLIGIFQKQSFENSISISNSPESITEGKSVPIGVKFSQNISDSKILKITSTNPAITVNGNSSVELTFHSSNSTTEQSITLLAVPDANRISEAVEIRLNADGIAEKKITINIIDTISRDIQVTIPATIGEDKNGSISISLGIKPDSGTTANVNLSADSSYVSLTNSSLQFTPDNYNTPQIVGIKINDIFNDNRNYTITSTTDGETVSKTTQIQDNDFRNELIILSNQIGKNNYGMNPSVDIFSAQNILFIANRDDSNSGNLRLTRYNLNTGDYQGIDYTVASNSAQRPKLSVDQLTGNLYIHAAYTSVYHPIFYNCVFTASSSSCSRITDFSRYSYYPKSLVYYSPDNSYSRLISITSDSLGQTAFFYRSNLDLTFDSSATLLKFSAQMFALGSRGLVFSSSTNRFYTVFTGNTSSYSNTPYIAEFDLNGVLTNSIYIIGSNSGLTPDLAIDPINSKLLIVSNDYTKSGIPKLSIFNLPDLSIDYSMGINNGKSSSSYFPKINVDTVNRKILVLAYDDDRKLFLYHCNLDGSSCKVTDVSFGFSVFHDPSEPNFDSMIDYANNRLMIAFTERATGRLYLTSVGLGGF